MTILEKNKQLSYKTSNSLILYKKPINKTNIYLYLNVIMNATNTQVIIRYLVLQEPHLNNLPLEQINFNNNNTNISNTIKININSYTTLNIFICSQLVNPNILKYKFNFCYLKTKILPFKSFFSINDLRYEKNNVLQKLPPINVKEIEEEYLSKLLENISI